MTQQQPNLMTSRAQTASEFLIILGVLLIGLSILAYNLIDIPSIGVNQESRVQNTFWEKADIGVIGAYSDGTQLSVTVKNNIEYDIVIQEVVVGEVSKTMSINLAPGDSVSVLLDIPESKPTVQITYQNKANSQEYIFQGPEIVIEEI